MNWDVEVQAALAQGAIALSVFSLITYLWLGATVLLMGDRRSLVTWAGALGLLSGALFFLSHGALVGAGVTEGSATDFWWHVSWLPAFAAPLFWAAIGLHYAGLAGAWKRLRMPALLAVATLGAFAALLALVSWPFIAHYDDFIRLLDAALRPQITQQVGRVSPAVPLLGLAFVVYIAACACLPWASLVVRRLLIEPRERASHSSEGAGTVGSMGTAAMEGESALLWDARDAWSRARPALLVASLFIMGAGAVVAVIGVLLAISQHRSWLLPFVDHLPQSLPIPATQPGHAPLLLVVADLCVQVALVGVGLMVGWAVVRQGVLVERRLPQRGFTSYWRGMAALAALFACVVAWMAALDAGALPDLLLLVALVALTCALLTWQSYVAHDRLLWQIRPFVASMSVGHTGWLATDPQEVERSVKALFTSLCRDVLGAGHGRLTVSAGRFSRAFAWQSPEREAVEAGDVREWTLPVSDERGVVARLTLGPRVDGAGYTSADLEIARACGQRILDAVGEFVAAQAVAQLARRRGLEAELSAALPRRALHDEILPRLHLAMLQLESLRARLKLSPDAVSAKTPIAVLSSIGETAPISAPTLAGDETAPDEVAGSADAALGMVVSELGKTHHDLARLMRAAPMASPRRMEHGFTGALRSSLDGEFRGVFDRLVWDAPPEAANAADALPAIMADLLLSAALEAVRNAGRHARGGDLRRKLTLRVTLAADAQEVTVVVADDGVGLRPAAPDSSQTSATSAAQEAAATEPTERKTEGATESEATPGTRSGLLTHAALVALIGGALTAHGEPGHGVTVTIRAPRGDA